MKHDHIDGMTDDLDLVIVGGYKGSKSNDGYSTFLLGTYSTCILARMCQP